VERSAVHGVHAASDPTAERIIEVAEGPGEHRETVPLVEERAIVRKREKVTDAVRVRTLVHEDEAVIDEPFTVEELDIERVAVDRWVDQPAQVRQEGEVTIIPVHEEVVVTEKRLRVAEEIRVTRRRVARRAEQRIALRREEAVVERPDAATQGSGDPD
jgi:stress response protein YsnF